VSGTRHERRAWEPGPESAKIYVERKPAPEVLCGLCLQLLCVSRARAAGGGGPGGEIDRGGGARGCYLQVHVKKHDYRNGNAGIQERFRPTQRPNIQTIVRCLNVPLRHWVLNRTREDQEGRQREKGK
jgi:hypothetical protein